MQYKVTGIVYETDGEPLDFELPTTMIVDVEDEDLVVDAISDETGFLVKSVESIELE